MNSPYAFYEKGLFKITGTAANNLKDLKEARDNAEMQYRRAKKTHEKIKKSNVNAKAEALKVLDIRKAEYEGQKKAYDSAKPKTKMLQRVTRSISSQGTGINPALKATLKKMHTCSKHFDYVPKNRYLNLLTKALKTLNTKPDWPAELDIMAHVAQYFLEKDQEVLATHLYQQLAAANYSSQNEQLSAYLTSVIPAALPQSFSPPVAADEKAAVDNIVAADDKKEKTSQKPAPITPVAHVGQTPPPPPPPPPSVQKKSHMPSMVAGAAKKEIPVQANPREDMLAAIRNGVANLNKPSVSTDSKQQPVSEANPLVAALTSVLGRRRQDIEGLGVMEGSDDDWSDEDTSTFSI